MAVAARSDKKLAKSADDRVVAMQNGSSVGAGSYVYAGQRLATGWHSHPLHQLEYAVEGLLEVDTASGRHLLAPSQAAWIPVGVCHQSIIHTSVRTISVFFEAPMMSEREARVRILGISPLLREMIGHAIRWPISRSKYDPVADRFFAAMADVVRDSLEHERPLTLPASAHPIIAAASSYVAEHLEDVTVSELSNAVGISERTLRRLFQSELHVSCRDYILQARLLQAMVLLALPNRTVLDTATAVGFANGSAFARVFSRHCGESPSSYRRRLHGQATR